MELTIVTDEDPRDWQDRLVERLVPRTLAWHPDPGAAEREARTSVERRLAESEVWRVLVEERPAGHVWLGVDHGDLVVYDLVVAEAALVPEVRDRLFAEARSRGLAGISASTAPGDAARTAFVDDPAFTLGATNLRLDLGAPSADLAAAYSGRVALTAMTEGEFAGFMDGEVESYAQERHAAGEPLEVSLDIAREQLADLLPDGVDSAGQHLFTVRESGAPVGVLWLSTQRPVVFVYDVELAPEHRGRGLGAAAMEAAAAWARERGAPAIGLNVFGHNVVARRLYDRLGYQVVEDHFRAPLS